MSMIILENIRFVLNTGGGFGNLSVWMAEYMSQGKMYLLCGVPYGVKGNLDTFTLTIDHRPTIDPHILCQVLHIPSLYINPSPCVVRRISLLIFGLILADMLSSREILWSASSIPTRSNFSANAGHQNTHKYKIQETGSNEKLFSHHHFRLFSFCCCWKLHTHTQSVIYWISLGKGYDNALHNY